MSKQLLFFSLVFIISCRQDAPTIVPSSVYVGTWVAKSPDSTFLHNGWTLLSATDSTYLKFESKKYQNVSPQSVAFYDNKKDSIFQVTIFDCSSQSSQTGFFYGKYDSHSGSIEGWTNWSEMIGTFPPLRQWVSYHVRTSLRRL